MSNLNQIDEKFAYLLPLWKTWLGEIKKYVPETNDYFNLIDGVSIQELEANRIIASDIQIPEELGAFYQIYNVSYATITSPFNFAIEGAEYDLLPFEDIKKEWEFNQNLNMADSFDPEIAIFSPKILMPKGYDYANPAWIPFAENKASDYLLFDTNPSSTGKYGQIIELINETWERNVVADSLADLIKMQIEDIKENAEERFAFILEED